MRTTAEDQVLRGVYGFFYKEKLVYVGSSHCKLTTLEFNHRNALTKWPDQKQTKFRRVLQKLNGEGYFKWLISPLPRNQKEVEILEGELIRSLNPVLNNDKNPVKSSIKYGRYE